MKTHARRHRRPTAIKRNRRTAHTKKCCDFASPAEQNRLYYLETAERSQSNSIEDVENEPISKELPNVDPALLAGAGI